jgi:hypothetical protein
MPFFWRSSPTRGSGPRLSVDQKGPLTIASPKGEESIPPKTEIHRRQFSASFRYGFPIDGDGVFPYQTAKNKAKNKSRKKLDIVISNLYTLWRLSSAWTFQNSFKI